VLDLGHLPIAGRLSMITEVRSRTCILLPEDINDIPKQARDAEFLRIDW
jgi:hypothetical protein